MDPCFTLNNWLIDNDATRTVGALPNYAIRIRSTILGKTNLQLCILRICRYGCWPFDVFCVFRILRVYSRSQIYRHLPRHDTCTGSLGAGAPQRISISEAQSDRQYPSQVPCSSILDKSVLRCGARSVSSLLSRFRKRAVEPSPWDQVEV